MALKLNSSDFHKGGFSNEECLQVVQWLNDCNLDLLELSGGSYEQPRLVGHTGEESSALEAPKAESTRRREAYFLEYAAAIRKVATMPLMVTGGFRTRESMEQAMREDAIDVIGLGRPLCTDPDVPKRLLNGEDRRLPSFEQKLRWSRRPASCSYSS